jgi:hypothetical protein
MNNVLVSIPLCHYQRFGVVALLLLVINQPLQRQ